LTANLAILIHPFLPFTAKKMLHMMKVVDKMLDWENAGKSKLLSVGYSLRPPELLFRKIEEEEVKAQIEKLQAAANQRQVETDKSALPGDQPATETGKLRAAGDKPQPPLPAANQSPSADQSPAAVSLPGKAQIVYDDFAKLDLRVGTIMSAEKVEKADKLLKLEVDMGNRRRTIVSGIAQHFKADEIVGKQVVVVANLAPRKMRGIESNGMILMAEDSSGKLYFVSPGDKIEPGSGVS
jgi:methionyl-tRNA synthetase